MGTDKFAHDSPEKILLMRIVLARCQRCFPRHASQDKDRCGFVINRGETVYVLHKALR